MEESGGEEGVEWEWKGCLGSEWDLPLWFRVGRGNAIGCVESEV